MNIKNKIFAALLICIAGTSCLKEKLETKYNQQEASIDGYIANNPTATRKATIIDTLSSYIDTTFIYDTTFAYTPGAEGSIDTVMIVDTIEKHEVKYETSKRDTTWTEELRVVYNNGSTRLVREEGTGPMLESNGSVSFYYAGYTFNGSVNASGLFATNHQATAEQAGWELTEADFQLYEINLNEARLVQGLKDGLYGVKAGEECEIVFSGKYGFGNENFGIIPANSALLYKIWVVGVSND